MDLAQITKLAGAHRRRKRVGRGRGSGRGKTATRGHKGGGSRAGWSARGQAIGGQMPVFRQLPKRGFSNAQFARRYVVVNLRDLERRFEPGDVVNLQSLMDKRLVRNDRFPVKVLGDGALSKELIVEAARFSEKAAKAIAAAGGEAKVV